MAGELLLQLETSSRAECEIVTHLPTDHTTRVTVTTHPAAASRTRGDAEHDLRQMGIPER